MGQTLRTTIALLLLALTAQGSPQDARPTQADIDAAVARALTYLKKTEFGGDEVLMGRGDELFLLAYLHGGMSPDDPLFQKRLTRLLGPPMVGYNRGSIELVGLRAMLLEDLDRVKYQEQIWSCAQELVDSQNPDGGWPQNVVAFQQAGAFQAVPRTRVKAAPANPEPGRREKPPVQFKVPVKKMLPGSPSKPTSREVDYSIFATLGLRACQDAGIVIPKNVLEKGASFWRETQKDGGWPRLAKETGPELNQTAGGIAALVSYHAMLGTDWTKDKAIETALKWFTKNYDTTGSYNGYDHPPSHYFRFYLERMTGLCGLEKIGDHDWNAEGVTLLLKRQDPSGSWRDVVPKPEIGETYIAIDTCLAVLFLKKISQSSRAKTASGTK